MKGLEFRVETHPVAGGKAKCTSCNRVLQSIEYGLGSEDETSITEDDRAALIFSAHDHLREKAGHSIEVVLFKRGA